MAVIQWLDDEGVKRYAERQDVWYPNILSFIANKKRYDARKYFLIIPAVMWIIMFAVMALIFFGEYWESFRIQLFTLIVPVVMGGTFYCIYNYYTTKSDLVIERIAELIQNFGKICHVCGNKHSAIIEQFPFCPDCVQEALRETEALVAQTEQQIASLERMGLDGQIEGAKKRFQKNLPLPLRWAIHNYVLFALQKEFPGAKKFNPYEPYNSEEQVRRTRFSNIQPDWEEVSLNSSREDTAIPAEGVKILEKFANLVGKEKFSALALGR